jgi:hypothetical protein
MDGDGGLTGASFQLFIDSFAYGREVEEELDTLFN